MNLKRIFESIFAKIFAKIKTIFATEPKVIFLRTEKEIDDLPIHSPSLLDPSLTEREVFKYSLDPRAWSKFDETHLQFTMFVKEKKILGMMNEMFKKRNTWIDSRSYPDLIASKKSANAFYDELDRVYSDRRVTELGARLRAAVLYGNKPEQFIVKFIQGKMVAWSNVHFSWTKIAA